MTIATIVAPPTTATAIRSAVERDDLDELIAGGLALHLFTEIAGVEVDLPVTDLDRATTVLTKQLGDTLARQPQRDVLRQVLQLVTDPERESHPDGRTAEELCGDAWPAVRNAAYARAEQSIRGADDYGVVPMLRLAATRAVAHQSLGKSPEHAPEDSLLAIVA